MTVSAAVRLIPKPPARVESKKMKMEGLGDKERERIK